MFRRYGIHGISGIGGESPIFGAISPEVSACSYELLARWNVPNQNFVNGQVLGVAEGVNVGQLTIGLVAALATIEVLNNETMFANRFIDGWDAQGWYSEAIARTPGKALLTSIRWGGGEVAVGWSTVQGFGVPSGTWEYFFAVNPGVNGQDVGYVGLGANILVGPGIAVGETGEFAVVLGGYDVNGEPWDSSLPIANFNYGASWYIVGGTYTDWTLQYRTPVSNSTPLYAIINYQDSGTVLYNDDFRIPVYDYSSCFQPLVKDMFPDVNGTSLDAHTPNVGGPWVEQNGDFDIQVNRANIVNDTGAFPRAIATLTGAADLFVRTVVNLPVTGTASGGPVYRYQGNNDFWQVDISDAANQIRLIETNGGVANVRASSAVVIAPATDYTVTVMTLGQDMRGLVDDANDIIWTSAFLQSETRCGIRGKDTGVLFDAFHVHQRSGIYGELDNCP